MFDKDNGVNEDFKPKDVKIIHAENKRLTSDINFPNIINIFLEDNSLKIKDYNVVTPVRVTEYFKIYANLLKEFEEISDESNNQQSQKLYNLVKDNISKKILSFIEKWDPSEIENMQDIEEKTLVELLMDKIQPIFQDILFLNYYFFIMEINEALLICPQCKRWFPVIQSIPRLFPKTMERQNIDIAFKDKWKSKFPKDVV
jgi:uncharacterized protein YbaR (Trm112 family)